MYQKLVPLISKRSLKELQTFVTQTCVVIIRFGLAYSYNQKFFNNVRNVFHKFFTVFLLIVVAFKKRRDVSEYVISS